MAAQFKEKDIDAAMSTMSSKPFVSHVPEMTGDVGLSKVRRFYNTYFIPHHPSDTTFVHVARTVGEDQLVDEFIHEFTSTIEMPWSQPRRYPTG
jgi:carboxymethylenebutenolidase